MTKASRICVAWRTRGGNQNVCRIGTPYPPVLPPSFCPSMLSCLDPTGGQLHLQHSSEPVLDQRPTTISLNRFCVISNLKEPARVSPLLARKEPLKLRSEVTRGYGREGHIFASSLKIQLALESDSPASLCLQTRFRCDFRGRQDTPPPNP